jgi:protein transport protein SEC24
VERENDTSKRIRSLISQVRSERRRYLHLQIVRQGTDILLEKEMNTFLVEDKTVDNLSYVDFLCAIHR